MSARDAILNGAKRAEEFHQSLGTENNIEKGLRSNVDVFGSLLTIGVNLLFRPLEGLLGACVEERTGVIITTNRSLSVQRFTGAHELGHVVMKHPASFDSEEILSGSILKNSDDKEIEANSFASAFLLPYWLIVQHAKRQKWGRTQMKDPAYVYQLSLRLGTSYEATVRNLRTHAIVDDTEKENLLRVKPRDIKNSIALGYAPKDWHRDVWVITEKDEGTFFEGQPDDIFFFRLNEKSGAGYLWDFETLRAKGFLIENDERKSAQEPVIGGPVLRVITAHLSVPQAGDIDVPQRRPWEGADNASENLKIRYNLLGKELGLPRAKRFPLALAA